MVCTYCPYFVKSKDQVVSSVRIILCSVQLVHVQDPCHSHWHEYQNFYNGQNDADLFRGQEEHPTHLYFSARAEGM